ncbi:MAG: hypothetical protein JO271_13365, partial [Verrucomicrobia bacterium]|nr:hypothetical protein [Verrucomicrobiota bacterium]
ELDLELGLVLLNRFYFSARRNRRANGRPDLHPGAVVEHKKTFPEDDKDLGNGHRDSDKGIRAETAALKAQVAALQDQVNGLQSSNTTAIMVNPPWQR